MLRMSSSGQLQLLRTTTSPEVYELLAQLYKNAPGVDVYERMMQGIEIKGEATLARYGLLELFRQTQKFAGYAEARESVKLALSKLSTLKHVRNLAKLTPGMVEFDVEYFFSDFLPWDYKQALIYHQGTVADAAGRGDLAFFKRLYNKVRNDQKLKSGGQYEHFLATCWLHGFLWLMPDKLACREAARRMERMINAAEREKLEGRKNKKERKLDYTTRAGHESQRKRFRQAVQSLRLFQHPDSPVIETRIPLPEEPNASCYVWKAGWPK
jgi:hypothetical protein